MSTEFEEEFEAGEWNFTVLADPKDHMVVLEFGEPVAWIGLDPEEARRLAELLVRCAAALDLPERTVN